MGLKKQKKKLDSIADNIYWKGWNDGWEQGYESTSDEAGEFSEGWDARGKNVQTRLKMLEEGYMREGKGAKAVMVREIAELIAIEIKTEISDEDAIDW